ncbi:MAG: Peptidoglycan-binding protein [Patescibacteria group bacterium]|nr:Peptidoglycan-binding protein [Patescibacteria group bacterium]
MKKIFKIAIVALAIVATGAATANAAFNANLSVGSTGADVSALQSWLISKGFAIPSISTGAAQPGYFGQQTKSAVVAYQASVGLPATGFVGPLTRGILNGSPVVGTTPSTSCPVGYTCTANPGTTPSTPSTGSLAGTDGSIASTDELSQYSDEEVGEGESDVKVLGFEVEASNDGDIALKSIKVVFDPAANASGDSDHLDDYVEAVTVWMGSTKIGSANVDDFTDNSDDTYSKTISLSNNPIVRADATEKFYITVDAVNSFDSSDIDSDAWTVGVDTVRFEDGSGVVTSEDTSTDIAAQELDFVSFSTSADTELKITTDSSANPTADVVMVDDSDTTDNVLLLSGKIRLDGTSDVLIDRFPVTFTVSGTATGLASTTGSVTLKIGDEEYTESVSGSVHNTTSSTVTFDNLDFDLGAGKTVTFSVYADIESVDGVLTEGDKLKASVTSSNRELVDAENEEGDQLVSSDKTGTATGEYQEFRTEGISVTLVGTPTAESNDNDAADTGTFTIKYKITAFGDTVYVASLAANAVTYAVYDSAGVATTSTTIKGTIKNETDTTKTTVGNYEIEEDSANSETFTLTITVPNGAGDATDQYYAALTGVLWDLSDDTSPSTTYSSNLDEFQTPTVNLDNN